MVMNKIDTLWDELKSPETVDASIEAQRQACAQQLHVEVDRVFPISAQKALTAKVRDDSKLLASSRLPELTDQLGPYSREQALRDHARWLLGCTPDYVRELNHHDRLTLHNRESTDRQYRLVDRAVELDQGDHNAKGGLLGEHHVSYPAGKR